MVIESRTIVGAAGAFALVGAVLWGSSALLPEPRAVQATVEVQQIHDRAWAVEVKDLGSLDKPAEVARTAAAR
jgi:hypothetical protein